MSSETTEPKRKFRLNAKNLFLTWPKNDVEPAEAMARVLEHFGADNVSYVCVSQEPHSDETLHLHCLVCLKSKADIRNAAGLDAITGKHGNYQTTRSVRDVLAYVKKGGVFVEHGISPVSESAKLSLRIAQALSKGASLEEVDEMDPGYFMQHQRNIRMYQEFHLCKRMKNSDPRPPLSISVWKTCVDIGYPRAHKEKQYWIHGPPNTGKTTFIRDLVENYGFRAYIIPLNNDFADFNNYYDISYIDEYRGQLSIQFLNQWLEGTQMKLNTKGGSNLKTKNMTTFILSNLSPMECYPGATFYEIEALMSRLHIICSK